VQYIAVPNKNL